MVLHGSEPVMTLAIRALSVFTLGLALLAAGGVHARGPEHHGFDMVMFEPPVPAPTFSAPTASGGSLDLERLAGRYVLLNFWATWCPPCVHEMPALEALHTRFAEHALTVVGVSLDQGDGKDVAEFARDHGITFPLALDPEGRISKAYGVRGLPATFLLDDEGAIVAAAQGAREWSGPPALGWFAEVLR